MAHDGRESLHHNLLEGKNVGTPHPARIWLLVLRNRAKGYDVGGSHFVAHAHFAAWVAERVGCDADILAGESIDALGSNVTCFWIILFDDFLYGAVDGYPVVGVLGVHQHHGNVGPRAYVLVFEAVSDGIQVEVRAIMGTPVWCELGATIGIGSGDGGCHRFFQQRQEKRMQVAEAGRLRARADGKRFHIAWQDYVIDT